MSEATVSEAAETSAWLQTSERLPEFGQRVLVTNPDMAPFMEIAEFKGGDPPDREWLADRGQTLRDITHWQPLPSVAGVLGMCQVCGKKHAVVELSFPIFPGGNPYPESTRACEDCRGMVEAEIAEEEERAGEREAELNRCRTCGGDSENGYACPFTSSTCGHRDGVW